jgi:hypothetical protein
LRRRTLRWMTSRQVVALVCILGVLLTLWIGLLASVWVSIDPLSSSTAGLGYLFVVIWGLLGLPVIGAIGVGIYAIWDHFGKHQDPPVERRLEVGQGWRRSEDVE